MSLIARLRAYAADAFGLSASPDDSEAVDERLAAIALLVHVARVDGVLDGAESERLCRLVEGRYAGNREEAEALIARAAGVDAQTRDMALLVEMMGHEFGETGARAAALSWHGRWPAPMARFMSSKRRWSGGSVACSGSMTRRSVSPGPAQNRGRSPSGSSADDPRLRRAGSGRKKESRRDDRPASP